MNILFLLLFLVESINSSATNAQLRPDGAAPTCRCVMERYLEKQNKQLTRKRDKLQKEIQRLSEESEAKESENRELKRENEKLKKKLEDALKVGVY